jgi:hypothetical protein
MVSHVLLLTAALAGASSFDASMPAALFRSGARADLPAPPGKPAEKPFFLDAAPKPLRADEPAGQALARMDLAAQLDRNLALLTLELGGRLFEVGAAGDAAFKNYYLTFRSDGRVTTRPLDLDKLRAGFNVEIAPGIVYNFKLSLSLMDPFRKSTLRLRPAAGTRGRPHDLSSGQILDAVKAKSFLFVAEGAEYWSLYGSDVDPAAGTFAATRSLLFVRYAGMDTKAWPLAEDALGASQPTRVQLASPVVMTRDAAELVIASGR